MNPVPVGTPSVELLSIQTDNIVGPKSPSGEPISPLQLIELAGRTCYKLQKKITHDSANDFVAGILARGHEAMIEFSWLTFRLPHSPSICNTGWLAQTMTHDIKLYVSEDDQGYLVSGNFRSFRDLLRKMAINSPQTLAIALYLQKYFPIIADDQIASPLNEFLKKQCQALKITINSPLTLAIARYLQRYLSVDDLFALSLDEAMEEQFNDFKKIGFYDIDQSKLTPEEKMKHYHVVGRFIGSRAFTHQLVRHRSLSFAQESQRYCDETGFFDDEYYVVPPSIVQAGLEKYFITALRYFNFKFCRLHKHMKDSGAKGKALNEDARFLLPNAVKSEICVAGNLYFWFKTFQLRLDSHAQWEIRGLFEGFRDQLFTAMPEAKQLYEVFLTMP